MAGKDDKTEFLLKHINDKADQNYQGILSRVERLENSCIKTSEMQHYATKDFVWVKFWIVCGVLGALALAVCTAYGVITPKFIDSQNSKLNQDIGKILDIISPHKNK